MPHDDRMCACGEECVVLHEQSKPPVASTPRHPLMSRSPGADQSERIEAEPDGWGGTVVGHWGRSVHHEGHGMGGATYSCVFLGWLVWPPLTLLSRSPVITRPPPHHHHDHKNKMIKPRKNTLLLALLAVMAVPAEDVEAAKEDQQEKEREQPPRPGKSRSQRKGEAMSGILGTPRNNLCGQKPIFDVITNRSRWTRACVSRWTRTVRGKLEKFGFLSRLVGAGGTQGFSSTEKVLRKLFTATRRREENTCL